MGAQALATHHSSVVAGRIVNIDLQQHGTYTGKGDRESLQAVVDALQEGANSELDPSLGDMALKVQTMNAIQSGKNLKQALNARTSSGQTPLMLACAHG
jgi:ankyrin repeat protein